MGGEVGGGFCRVKDSVDRLPINNIISLARGSTSGAKGECGVSSLVK